MIEKKDSEDTEGVSPVIGVILMVAITVILAALIGSFVLGVGQDIDETPRAGVEVIQDSDSLRLTVINSGNLDSAQIVGPQGGKSMRFKDTFGVGARIIIVDGPSGASFNDSSSDFNNTALPPGSDARAEASGNDLVGNEKCIIRHSADVVRTVEINGTDIGCSGKLLEEIAGSGAAGSLDDPDFAGSKIKFQSDSTYQFIGQKGSSSSVIRRIRSGDF
jgi:flagellin-like protein